MRKILIVLIAIIIFFIPILIFTFIDDTYYIKITPSYWKSFLRDSTMAFFYGMSYQVFKETVKMLRNKDGDIDNDGEK